MPEDALPTLTESALRGIACRCPRCGKGKLYAGFIDLRPRCEACGLDYAFIDAGDGPAIFIIMPAGAVVVGAALIVEIKYQPPFWLHAALWLPLILATTLLPLRSMKALLIALQFHHKAAEGRLIDHLGHQRREHHNGAADQDDEHRRPVAGIGEAVVEPATLAGRPQSEKALEQPALAATRTATAQSSADRQRLVRHN